MSKQNTHQDVNQRFCGKPIELRKNFAKLTLRTTEEMIVDNTGLIHGGFIFGLADYCAMLAVNHPNVVLGKAKVEFLKPVKLYDTLIANGNVTNTQNREIYVNVNVYRNGDLVFDGIFTCFIPKQHILKRG
ncbi:MAG: hotdog domain-containing protein [Candidatus Thorarchaeota archaeon]